MSEKFIKLDVKPNKTIYQIKQKIYEQTGHLVKNQKLMFVGQPLEDDKTIGFYLIGNATLHLVIVDPNSSVEDIINSFDTTEPCKKLTSMLEKNFPKSQHHNNKDQTKDCCNGFNSFLTELRELSARNEFSIPNKNFDIFSANILGELEQMLNTSKTNTSAFYQLPENVTEAAVKGIEVAINNNPSCKK